MRMTFIILIAVFVGFTAPVEFSVRDCKVKMTLISNDSDDKFLKFAEQMKDFSSYSECKTCEETMVRIEIITKESARTIMVLFDTWNELTRNLVFSDKLSIDEKNVMIALSIAEKIIDKKGPRNINYNPDENQE